MAVALAGRRNRGSSSPRGVVVDGGWAGLPSEKQDDVMREPRVARASVFSNGQRLGVLERHQHTQHHRQQNHGQVDVRSEEEPFGPGNFRLDDEGDVAV